MDVHNYDAFKLIKRQKVHTGLSAIVVYILIATISADKYKLLCVNAT